MEYRPSHEEHRFREEVRAWLHANKPKERRPEDGFLSRNFARFLRLKSGIIKDQVCFHACGPHYAKQFGHLDREIEKYAQSKLPEFVDRYRSYQDKP